MLAAQVNHSNSGHIIPINPANTNVLPSQTSIKYLLIDDFDPISALGVFTPPAVNSFQILQFAGDFFNRIWLIPNSINVKNPKKNKGLQFGIWNAYLFPNNLKYINKINGKSITFALKPPHLFDSLQYIDSTVSVTGSESIIDSEITFKFESGEGIFKFFATISNIFLFHPEIGQIEKWEWLTDVISLQTGSERRISLRDSPRLKLTATYIANTTKSMQNIDDEIFNLLQTKSNVPFYQYSTSITKTSFAGALKIYFDKSKAFIGDNSHLLIWNRFSPDVQELNITKVNDEGADLKSRLTSDVNKGWLLTPLMNCATNPKLQSKNTTTSKTYNINFNISPKSEVSKDYKSTILSIEGIPVLEARPLVNSEIQRETSTGVWINDNKTGIIDYTSLWMRSYTSKQLEFLIDRFDNENQLFYWWDFLNEIKGRQKKFLLPTFLPDLTLVKKLSETEIVVNQINYETLYFPHKGFKYIYTNGENGLQYSKVEEVSLHEESGLKLKTETKIKGSIELIGLLKLYRLDSDMVSIIHQNNYSVVNLAVKEIDE